MSAPRRRQTQAIPLPTHESIVAALYLCSRINNDNNAVVMLKGYSDDFENFTGIYLEDYSADDLGDADCFAGYEDAQLWVTLGTEGVR